MASKIFFSIKPQNAGFTDQLLQFSAIYRLGLSLGFIYWHIPFFSSRSSRKEFPSRVEIGLDILRDHFPLLGKFIKPAEGFNVYDFIGFDAYFLARTEPQNRPPAKMINLVIRDEVVHRHGIKTLADLQLFVRQKVAGLAATNPSIWVQFRLKGNWPIWQPVFSVYPDNPDEFDLRKIYFSERQTHPWPEKYLEGKVKSIIHIRQGDTAVLPTPWGTYVALWPQEDKFKEFAKVEAMSQGQQMILVEDYFNFYKELSDQLDLPLSTLVFSDGFDRALQKISRRKKRLHFNLVDEKVFLDSLKTLDQTEFLGFSALDDCRLFIGEESENLCHLIHSFLTADLVIMGIQQWMIPKLIALYCNAENMPLVVVLHKSGGDNYWRYEGLNLGARMDKIMFVNINGPDFSRTAEKVRRFLANEGH